MNNNNQDPLKTSIDDLVKEAVNDHKEHLDEIEADLFLEELENKGFFEKRRKRPYLFILTSVILLTGSLFYIMSNQVKPKEETPYILRIRKPKTDSTNLKNEVLANSGNYISKQDTDSLVRKLSDKKLISQDQPNTSKDEKIAVRDEAKVTKSDPTELRKTEEENTIPTKIESNKEAITSTGIKNKDSVRVRYVIEVDTIKNQESVKIKKKKWDKMNNKK